MSRRRARRLAPVVLVVCVLVLGLIGVTWPAIVRAGGAAERMIVEVPAGSTVILWTGPNRCDGGGLGVVLPGRDDDAVTIPACVLALRADARSLMYVVEYRGRQPSRARIVNDDPLVDAAEFARSMAAEISAQSDAFRYAIVVMDAQVLLLMDWA